MVNFAKLEELIDRWRRTERMALRPGASDEAIHAREREPGVRFPPEMVAFFTAHA